MSFQGQWSFVRTVPFVRLFLRCRCARTELITPDLICPSTYQLLWNSGCDSEPDLSFDKSASPERLFSSARVSPVACRCIFLFLKVDLVKTYRIPVDIHPRLPDLGFTMDHFPTDDIGIYSEFLWFSGVHVPFLTFLLSVLKYFKVHIFQLVPLGLNKVVSFEVVCRDLNIVPTVTLFYRRAIPDHLTWIHSCSCVLDDLPFDGYDRNDVQRLCARLIRLCEMKEEVLVRFGLSSVWFNEECDPIFQRVDDNGEMSIYDFMTLPSWSNAKIVEESHHFSLPLLERVSSHTTAPTTEGAIIPLSTPDEIAASLPDSRLVKKSKC
ncbi:hypothetical protein Tco_0895059 [Tanacetum coccineum]|uniref:Transposase (putative) gypsy type domain-containing protein n=1 Tax=Tanacetum coccineum TaxID=301880 RepID=A0ABQ5CFV6_9ASTR